jgi:tetraacyldisaccharide 4'-kinase
MLSLENWLNHQWYKKNKPNLLLRFLSIIYAFFLRFQTDQSTEKLGVPIIIVGNFTVGGTGKTPLIIGLIKYLEKNGFKPGVVSRGYGRRSSTPLTVNADSLVSESGDEPLLIARQTNVPVRVDSNRRRAALHLIQQGCTIILADDGLQHRNLPRDIEIEVIDSQRVYGNGLLLPAGPMREPVRPVTLRVSNGSLEDQVNYFAMQLGIDHCYLLHTQDYVPLQHFSGQSVIAMAGIGNPDRFFEALRSHGLKVEGKSFADHHALVESDFPSQGSVFITEKDAVKCKDILRDNICVVPALATLSDNFYQEFIRQVNLATQRNV